jgi:hypothetical protein
MRFHLDLFVIHYVIQQLDAHSSQICPSLYTVYNLDF